MTVTGPIDQAAVTLRGAAQAAGDLLYMLGADGIDYNQDLTHLFGHVPVPVVCEVTQTVVGQVLIGHTASDDAGEFDALLQVHALSDDAAAVGVVRWGADTNPARFTLGKSRGAAIGTNGIVVTGDDIGSLDWAGDDGVGLLPNGTVSARILVEAVDTIAADRIPTRMSFWVATNAAPSVLTNIMQMSTAGVEIPGAGGSSTRIGYSCLSPGTSSIAIGNAANAASNTSIAIGASAATATTDTIAIGNTAVTGAGETGGIAIGAGASIVHGATGGGQNIAIGASSTASEWRATAVGFGATASAISATAVGRGATASATHAIAIGRGSWCATANTIAIGHSGGDVQTDVYFESGHTHKYVDYDSGTVTRVPSSTPIAIHGFDAYDATVAPTSDVAGGNLILAAGRGTGTAVGGHVLLQTAAASGGSSNVKNTLVTVLDLTDTGESLFTGNLGINVTPEAWHSDFSVLQFGSHTALWATTAVGVSAQGHLSQNMYWDGAYKHIINDESSDYFQQDGTHIFRVAPADVADSAVVWTTAMTIANDGLCSFDKGVFIKSVTAVELVIGASTTAPQSGLMRVYETSTVLADDMSWSGTQYIARDTAASFIILAGGSVTFLGDTGLTAGNAYSPTTRMTIAADGDVTGGATGSWALQNVTGSNTVPTLCPDKSVPTTGWGSNSAADRIHGIISGQNTLIVRGTYAGNPLVTSGSRWLGITFDDNVTAGSGTAAAVGFHAFSRPTLVATNALVTTTDSATVYIENSPLASTNQTITNPWALWVDAGNVRLDGIIRYAGTMGNSALNPATDAPADWVEIEIGGTTYYVPAYAAS